MYPGLFLWKKGIVCAIICRMEKKKLKIAIAMSGGVDSAVAAKILVDQGYEVVGFMMKLWSDPSACSSRENACCDAQGVLDAKKVAEMLGIPFYLLNAKEIFKKHVVDYFLEEYKNLRTPNPCVVCNDKIKFGWLLDFAKKTGCDYLATGHYARIIASESSITHSTSLMAGKKQSPVNNQLSNSNNQNNTDNTIYRLLKGKDENKDQSYFLYNLNQEQLSQIMFPVGEFTKTKVRAMAKKWHLPVFEKRESQEICFIQDKDFREFLKRNIPSSYFNPGEIVDSGGVVLGKHDGLINYTIGQRRGIDQISDNSRQITVSKQPLYVIGFDVKRNQLIVGEDREVYMDKMQIIDLHFIQNNESRIMNNGEIQVKIRYRHPAVGGKFKIHDSKYIIQFDEPQRAITPGQSAVFYDGDEVLGGGIIG
jgi:tRNA-specific 2-thiouridylase